MSPRVPRSGYVVREYSSWYNVIYKGDDGCKLKRNPEDVTLWIKRPTAEVTETPHSMTDEAPFAEFRADAILGIIKINGSLYLNLVVSSEPVANVSFGEVTASDCKTSPIFSVKMIRMLPIEQRSQYQAGYQQSVTDRELSDSESSERGRSPSRRSSNLSAALDRDGGDMPNDDPNLGIINDLNQLLTTGHYFSRATDLTRSMQRQWELGFLPLKPRRFTGQVHETADTASTKNGTEESNASVGKSLFEIADPTFNWSRGMLHGIPSHWITVLMQGYVGYSIHSWNGKRVELMLIGRRSTYRYGTRLNARGIDEDGNVGNFVESELRLRVNKGFWKSFVQVRGSIPVFWGQKNIFSPAYFTRPLNESEAAFLLHYKQLETLYGEGSEICFMSLLDTKASEIALTQGMEHIDHTFPDMNLHMVRYNYNEKVKWSTMLYELLTFVNLQLLSTMQRIGYFDGKLMKESLKVAQRHRLDNGRIEGTQRGVIRTNCLDCLDRTNAMQLMVGWVWLASMLDPDGLSNLLELDNESDFNGSLRQFRDMWCAHGDAVSFHYAGTASIYSQHIREGKQSYVAMFHYTKTMVTRACSYVFNDEARQNCMDMLINGQNPQVELQNSASSSPRSQPSVVQSENIALSDVTVWCGTWNMNGSVLSNKDDMSDWISTGVKHGAEIYVFFLQEFVELSMLNVLSGKTEENKEMLFNGKAIRILTAMHEDKNVKFVHLKSCSMVGLYVTAFVSERLRPSVRNLTTTTVKTGFSGNVGNKGAVGLKFEIGGQRLTLIDVHLNFGKLPTRVRIQELEYVMKNTFDESEPDTLYDDDLFVLAGDFNFQIAMNDEDSLDIMDELYAGNLERLLRADEFLSEVKRGPPHLSNLQEAPIRFEPTYKFKVGTSFYHMKRPPAWCDRILYGGSSVLKKSRSIKCLSYMRHDGMVSSDHKAVSGVFKLSSDKLKKELETISLIDL